MNTEREMTVVTAVIRPHMEARVVQALHDLPEFPGFFVAQVRAQSRGRGAGGAYRPSELDLTYHQFLQLQIVCRTEAAGKICDAVAAAAWTGHKGDGVIFTTDANSCRRIREAGAPGKGASP